MILQALNRYYEILQKSEIEIPSSGYSTVGVSFALNISEQGELLEVLPLLSEKQRGKKTVEAPRSMMLPAVIKRSVNVAPNFLWDNPVYVLGISDKAGAEDKYCRERFDAFGRLTTDLLTGVDDPAARAVLAFVQRREPATMRDHPALRGHQEALLKGGNVVFLFRGCFVHDAPKVRQVWADYLAGQGAIKMQCLVTGRVAPIARLHPDLKRVRGAQAKGASLVGFNAAAYESYNRSQGQVAPVSEQATFAYTTVLNYLLSDANPNKKFSFGDTTVVYWAESDNRGFEPAFAGIIAPEYLEDVEDAQVSRNRAEAAGRSAAQKVKRGHALDLRALLAELGDENPRFYILGLAPNAARVSVRFFIADLFEKIAENIMTHYRDLAIVKEYDDQPDYLTVGQILRETVSRKAKDKDASPLLAGSVLRAILTNAPYPAALFNAVIIRIRADMDDSSKGISKINYIRAAVIKAFLLRKYRHQPDIPFMEVLTVSLNERSTNPAYVLGRLFAVLEKVQQEAIESVNASIRDRYFTSACASPATVFPTLLQLAHHHISKAKYGYVSDHRIQEILGLLDVETNPIPARLTLEEQGAFVLGYYHQRKDLRTAKPKNSVEATETGN